MHTPRALRWSARVTVVASLLVAQTTCAQDSEQPGSGGGLFLNPSGLLTGTATAELAFGVKRWLSVNLRTGYSPPSSETVASEGFGFGAGLQLFALRELYRGPYLMPYLSIASGYAEVADGMGGQERVDALVLSPGGTLGYQWDWQPLSIRLGIGVELLRGFVNHDGEDSIVDRIRPVLDATVGLTWESQRPPQRDGYEPRLGRSSRPRPPSPRRRRHAGRIGPREGTPKDAASDSGRVVLVNGERAELVHTRIQFRGVSVLLQGRSAASDGGPWLGLLVEPGMIAPTLECPVVLLVDGKPLSRSVFHHVAGESGGQYSATTNLDALDRLAKGERVTGQVCDLHFLFSREAKDAVRQFVKRFREARQTDEPVEREAESEGPSDGGPEADPQDAHSDGAAGERW